MNEITSTQAVGGTLGQDQCAASPHPTKIKHLEVNGMNKSHTEGGVFPSEATVAEQGIGGLCR